MSLSSKVIKWVEIIGKPQSNDDINFVESLSADDSVSLEIAQATLLVDLALIDSKFDAREREFIINTLSHDQGLSRHEVDNLVKSITAEVQFRGSHSMAVELQKRLGTTERKQIANKLEKLLVADSHQDGFEVYLIKKMKDLLGVD